MIPVHDQSEGLVPMYMFKCLLALICLGIGAAFSTVATIDILTNDESFSGPVWMPAIFGSMFWLGTFLLSWWKPSGG
jgi:hypothetical protein